MRNEKEVIASEVIEGSENELQPNEFFLTLESHPGQALVLRESTESFGGRSIIWTELGEESQAVKV